MRPATPRAVTGAEPMRATKAVSTTPVMGSASCETITGNARATKVRCGWRRNGWRSGDAASTAPRGGSVTPALRADQAGVLSAEPAGSGLHVFCSPQLAATDYLTQVLNDAGFGPVTVGPVEPSVEDLFIALVKKEARGAA